MLAFLGLQWSRNVPAREHGMFPTTTYYCSVDSIKRSRTLELTCGHDTPRLDPQCAVGRRRRIEDVAQDSFIHRMDRALYSGHLTADGPGRTKNTASSRRVFQHPEQKDLVRKRR